jgi:hypothetical protein
MDSIKYRTSSLLPIPIKEVRFHIKFALYFMHIPNHQPSTPYTVSRNTPKYLYNLGYLVCVHLTPSIKKTRTLPTLHLRIRSPSG